MLNETSTNSIDKIDLQILYMLHEDSRTTFKKIADKVNLTSTSVATRVNNLYEQGIISQFTINLDFNKICNGPRYMIHLSIPIKLLNFFLVDLSKLSYAENVQIVAEKFNVIVNTFPITPNILEELIIFIQGSSVSDFRICPIISIPQSSNLPRNLIVEGAFCPQCHSRYEGETITSKINNNLMTFCCNGCVDAFHQSYNNIINSV